MFYCSSFSGLIKEENYHDSSSGTLSFRQNAQKNVPAQKDYEGGFVDHPDGSLINVRTHFLYLFLTLYVMFLNCITNCNCRARLLFTQVNQKPRRKEKMASPPQMAQMMLSFKVNLSLFAHWYHLSLTSCDILNLVLEYLIFRWHHWTFL